MKNWKTLLLGIAMIANTSFAAPQVVDKVAAVVNNGVVLESDVDGLMQSDLMRVRLVSSYRTTPRCVIRSWNV